MAHKSTYDVWSGRCCWVAYGQAFLAGSYLCADIAQNFRQDKQDVYIHPTPPRPTLEQIAAIPPVLFPLASLICWSESNLKALQIFNKERVSPLVFGAFQSTQLIVCAGLTVYDAIKYRNFMFQLFWISLVLYFFPAVIGFGHAMIGLRIYYSRKEPFVNQGSENEFEPYTDFVEQDDGPLGRAFRLQDEGEAAAAEEEEGIQREDHSSKSRQDMKPSIRGDKPTLSDASQIIAAIEPSLRVKSHPLHGSSVGTENIEEVTVETNAALLRNQSSSSTTLQDRISTAQPADSDRQLGTQELLHPYIRMPWQEDLKNGRNLGRSCWFRFLVIGILSITSCNQGSGAIRNIKYLDENLKRQIMLISYVPPLVSFMAMSTLHAAFLRPRFFVILLSTCSSVAAILVWTMAFVTELCNFVPQLPFGMLIITLLVLPNHCYLLFISMSLEWEPHYQSFIRKLGYSRQ